MRYDVGVGRYPTRDHILPRSRLKVLPGSMTHGENLVMVCQGCNVDKGAMLLIEWWAALLHAGDERARPVALFIHQLLGRLPAEAPMLIGLGREDDYATATPLHGAPSSGALDARCASPRSPPCATQRPTLDGLPQQAGGA